jgi:UDP-glucose 4-epimerase
VKKLVWSSSASVYGLGTEFAETSPVDPRSAYAWSKYMFERYVSSKSFDIKVQGFRYFNVYGPREPIKGPYAPVVGLFLRQKSFGQSLTIVGDGTQRRDFTHVDDVVNANILAMQHVDLYAGNQTYGKVYNVGTGRNHSVLELARMISDVVKFIPPRPAESKVTLADKTRIYETFGWKPSKKIEDYIRNKI